MDPISILCNLFISIGEKFRKYLNCWRNIFWNISAGKTESQPQCAMPLIPLGHALLIFCCRTGICHTDTHTLGPFRPLTSAKWQLHQGGHRSSKKTIMFSVNERAYVSDEAFITYPKGLNMAMDGKSFPLPSLSCNWDGLFKDFSVLSRYLDPSRRRKSEKSLLGQLVRELMDS